MNIRKALRSAIFTIHIGFRISLERFFGLCINAYFVLICSDYGWNVFRGEVFCNYLADVTIPMT